MTRNHLGQGEQGKLTQAVYLLPLLPLRSHISPALSSGIRAGYMTPLTDKKWWMSYHVALRAGPLKNCSFPLRAWKAPSLNPTTLCQDPWRAMRSRTGRPASSQLQPPAWWVRAFWTFLPLLCQPIPWSKRTTPETWEIEPYCFFKPLIFRICRIVSPNPSHLHVAEHWPLPGKVLGP